MTERQKQLLWRRKTLHNLKDVVVSTATAMSALTFAVVYNNRYYEKPWSVVEVIAFGIALLIAGGYIVANFIRK